MEYIVAVDIGGTATDCVVIAEDGTPAIGKAFSTPPTFVEGVLDSVGVAAQALGLSRSELLGKVRLFLHSTTIAENAIATGDLAKVGMVVTKGFEDTLVMMRGAYGRWSGLTEEEIRNPLDTEKPPPLVPRALIRGVRERTDALGRVLLELSQEELKEIVTELRDQGVEGLGVAFLCSYSNPENERRAKELVAELYPDLYVSASSELAPAMGEYERTSTTALNVALGPLVATYLAGLRDALQVDGFAGTLLVLQSYAGLLSLDEASSRPVGTVESGPVAGLSGSKYLGDILGIENIVAADMGGTTFKAGVIREGRIEYQRSPAVLRYHYLVPKMDVVSLGIAGGSVVWLDTSTGTPRIGPRSAGARPGPVAYGFGGTDATVTDVDLLLGYLNSSFFLGGRASLDQAAAEEAFATQLAEPLGLSLRDAAGAVYRLANSLMFDHLHKMTVEKGFDPRRFVLFSYGGTAGMHLGPIGRELGVQKVVVPFAASVQSAYGLSTADVAHEYQTTRPMMMPADVDAVDRIFAELVERTRGQLAADGFSDDGMSISASIDMRYAQQVHEITAPFTLNGRVTEDGLSHVCAVFVQMYESRYGEGSGSPGSGVELVAFRVRGGGAIKKPVLRAQDVGGTDPSGAFVEERSIYVYGRETSGAFVDANGYDFERLQPGNVVEGPAVIWTPITTVVVSPDQRAEVDKYKNIVLTW